MSQLALIESHDRVDSLVLRDYQTQALDEIRDHIAKGTRRILCCAMTGAGKTVMFAEICARAHDKGNKALVVSHRMELIKQTYKMMLRAGIAREEIGIRCGKLKPFRNDSAPHQICSVQCLRQGKVPAADLLIIDECKHVTKTNSYGKVIAACPDSILLGFDATPIRYDNHGLGEVFEVLVQVSSPSKLIADGHLMATEIIVPEDPVNLAGVHVRAGDYVAEELEDLCNTDELRGDAVRTYQRYGQGLPALCFCISVQHSRQMQQQYRAAGIAAEHLDDKTPDPVRASIFERFEAGEVPVICNVGITTEGTDLPNCKVVQILRPTKSLALWIQMCGRGMRPDPARPGIVPKILDHAGLCKTFGPPEMDRIWSLELPPELFAGEPPVKECDSLLLPVAPGKDRGKPCLLMSPSGARECRACGHPFYPRCPVCKPRYHKLTKAFVGECKRCSKGITPIADIHNPPASLECACCQTLFAPYRNVIFGKAGMKPKTAEPTVPTPEPMPAADLATQAQIDWLKRKGISAEQMTRAKASETIRTVQKRQQLGLCTIKQARVLSGFGLNPDIPFEEAKKVIDQIANCDWLVPEEIKEKYAQPLPQTAQGA